MNFSRGSARWNWSRRAVTPTSTQFSGNHDETGPGYVRTGRRIVCAGHAGQTGSVGTRNARGHPKSLTICAANPQRALPASQSLQEVRGKCNDTQLCHYLSETNFMKIGSDIQAILRVCLRNLRGYNVGITNG
jgi:hypothetical protein